MFVQLAKCKDRNLNYDDQFGRTPLTSAASGGHVKLVKEMLARGVKPTSTSNRTALSRACQRGHKDIVRELLEHQKAAAAAASKAAEDDWDMNMPDFVPIVSAGQGGFVEIIDDVLEAGGKAEAPNRHGNTALHWAVRNGFPKSVLRLLDAGAEVRFYNWFRIMGSSHLL